MKLLGATNFLRVSYTLTPKSFKSSTLWTPRCPNISRATTPALIPKGTARVVMAPWWIRAWWRLRIHFTNRITATSRKHWNSNLIVLSPVLASATTSPSPQIITTSTASRTRSSSWHQRASQTTSWKCCRLWNTGPKSFSPLLMSTRITILSISII